MGKSIPEALSGKGYDWFPAPPASDEAIAELIHSVSFEFPQEFLELLRFCNGGSGELNAPPLLFVLDKIQDAIAINAHPHYQEVFHDFWFFGNNAGLEMIAFDLRTGPPWPIVAIDPIAGPESAMRIAESMADFIPLIGIKSNLA